MDEYPSRVTLFDDGVYRWSYDMDMWHNRFMLKLVAKVLGVICAALCAMFILLLGPTYIDLKALGIMALSVAGIYALALGIYAICALAMHGNYHLLFEMDDTAVALVQSAASKQRLSTLGIIATIASVASGDARLALRTGSTLAVANSVGTTRFSSVTRVKLYPESDVIFLREWFGMNQIYVNPDDYPFVRDFMLERVRDKAKRGI